MQILSDYLQPLTYWIYENPSWALLITFLISLGESLAIIGSIIPGSVTMTAIGILAGSGIMRVDLTLIAATLGAIAGDGSSYILGYVFRHRLPTMWPFSRYPHWLLYGKAYFAKHGGKSVLIGRFIGPLRAIIPVIAGMMHMNHWQFLMANVLSAIGWSVLYIMPGVLIGSASSELSAESASRLFMFVILALIVIWGFSIGLKWLFKRLNAVLEVRCNEFWSWSKGRPKLDAFLTALTPDHETNHYHTALLLFYFFIGFLFSTTLTLLSYQGYFLATINAPVYFFFQSLRTIPFDTFFIVINLFINTVPLASLVLTLIVVHVVRQEKKALKSWIMLIVITCIVALSLNKIIGTPEDLIFKFAKKPTYPDLNLCFATAIFGLILLISNDWDSVKETPKGSTNPVIKAQNLMSSRVIRFSLITLLILAGLSTIYLGKNSLTHVFAAYGIGLMLCLGQWLYYRQNKLKSSASKVSIKLACIIYLVTALLSYPICYNKLIQTYSPFLKQYVLTNYAWWHQSVPVLPLYATNRIGKPVSYFNLQYSGPIKSLETVLLAHGWEQQNPSFFHTLLRHTSPQNHKTPKLMSQLYLNRKPTLLLTKYHSKTKEIAVIRLWRSNFHLKSYPQPLWLGSIEVLSKNKHLQAGADKDFPFSLVIPALDHAKTKMITFDTEAAPFQTIKKPVKLLLIKLPQKSIQ